MEWTLDGEYGGEMRKVVIQNQKQFLRIMVDSDFAQTYSNTIEGSSVE